MFEIIKNLPNLCEDKHKSIIYPTITKTWSVFFMSETGTAYVCKLSWTLLFHVLCKEPE